MIGFTVISLSLIGAIFVLALVSILLGRKLDFRLGVAWNKASIEFAASERNAGGALPAPDGAQVVVEGKAVPKTRSIGGSRARAAVTNSKK